MEAVPTQLPESRERAKVPVSWPVTHVKSRVHKHGKLSGQRFGMDVSVISYSGNSSTL